MGKVITLSQPEEPEPDFDNPFENKPTDEPEWSEEDTDHESGLRHLSKLNNSTQLNNDDEDCPYDRNRGLSERGKSRKGR